MSSYVLEYKTDFSGGEHDAIAVDNIRQNEMVECVNLDPDIAGGLMQREGTVDFRTTITNKRKDRILEFEYLSGTTRMLKRLELIDGKIIDPDTPDAGMSYKILYTGAGDHLDFEVFSNKVYILTGTDYLVYDGSTITAVTNADAGSMLADVKKCRYLIKKGDRMIFSGHSEKPNYILYSQRLRPDYVKDSSANDTINPVTAMSDDGDVVTGLEVFKDNILIFKRRSIFSISGTDPMTNWVMKRLDTHTGAVSHRTIDKVGDYLFFLGYDKRVYRLATTESGDVAVKCMSTNKDMSKINLPLEAHLTTAHSVFYKGKYILSAPTGADYKLNDTLFVFNTDIWQRNGGYECWYRYQGLNISDMFLAYDGTLFGALVTGGKTVKFDPSSLTDSGVHIKCVIEPHSFNGVQGGEESNALKVKAFKTGHIMFRQFLSEATDVNVYRNVDGVDYYGGLVELIADDSLVFDEGSYDRAKFDFNDVAPMMFIINKRGLKCRVRIETDETTPNNRLAIYGVGVKYRLKKLFRG